MRTTAFVAFTRRSFGNQVRNSQKGGRAMKALKSLLVLAALGIGSPVHANGPVTIYPENINGVGVTITNGQRNTQLILNDIVRNMAGGNISSLNSCNGGNRITVDLTDPIQDRAFVLFNTATLTGQALRLWVQCWADFGATAITVDMFHDE